MSDNAQEGEGDTYIIKKIKKGGGHHGGAWKVAYADFVTAMMAFFLLLWLLNVTTEEQKNAISNYFDPTHPKVSEASSGAGGVLGGLSVAPKGAQVTNVQPITPQEPSQTTPSLRGRPDPTPNETQENLQTEKVDPEAEKRKQEEEKRFEETMKEIEERIKEVPALTALADNLIIDMTPEGLRIQVVDSDGKSMFATGSAEMLQEAQLLVGSVTEIISGLPNEVSIRGHTDSEGYGPDAVYTNWELSADRANTTRRVMKEFEYPPEKVNNVLGKADTEHLIKKDPYDARNRRISIILLKEELTRDPEEDVEDEVEEEEGQLPKTVTPPPLPAPAQPPPVGTFRRTPGAVEFP